MKRRRVHTGKSEFIQPNSDERFAFIVGYTEGGFPYGTTWDELLADAHREEETMAVRKRMHATNDTFRDWAPDIDKWPASWMGVKEDLAYGRAILSYFEQFLQELYDECLPERSSSSIGMICGFWVDR